MITTLRIKKEYEDGLEVAIKYYSLISILNNFKLSPLDVKVLAYTAIEGNISAGGKKKKCMEIFKSTSIDNVISRLTRKHFLVKIDGKIIVNPQLQLDFNNDLLLQLNLIKRGG